MGEFIVSNPYFQVYASPMEPSTEGFPYRACFFLQTSSQQVRETLYNLVLTEDYRTYFSMKPNSIFKMFSKNPDDQYVKVTIFREDDVPTDPHVLRLFDEVGLSINFAYGREVTEYQESMQEELEHVFSGCFTYFEQNGIR
jgi:hypothetical protein